MSDAAPVEPVTEHEAVFEAQTPDPPTGPALEEPGTVRLSISVRQASFFHVGDLTVTTTPTPFTADETATIRAAAAATGVTLIEEN